MSLESPVKLLNGEVARKIAAGEVIDRPNAIIRELMDNAIDSGADSITVEISGGGIEKIRIIDNGCGMTKEDLQNCARPHATSKISTETDLMNLHTLGFRGEALASIAAVARLSISSGSWKMRSSIIEDHILEPIAEFKGTIVQSEGLFENFPARRQFLKRPATEALMCKNTFIEKAMSRPDIAFKLIIDGQVKLNLSKNQSLKDRFVMANSYTEDSALFYEIKVLDEHSDFDFSVIIGEPAVSRTNKKEIFIYTNGRKIQEYSLVQAVEYGGQGFFPNGTYPVAAVFINMNPQLVDFNIHPAKKEARFYDISQLHHSLSQNIRRFFQSYTYKNFQEDKPSDSVRLENSKEFRNHINYKVSSDFSRLSHSSPSAQTMHSSSFGQKNLNVSDYKKSNTFSDSKNFSDFRSKFFSTAKEKDINKQDSKMEDFEDNSLFDSSVSNLADLALAQNNPAQLQVKYIGPCLGTFLLAEKNNCLYIFDQHAVHERILFDKIMNNQGNRQDLLIPYKIQTDSKSQDKQLENLKDRLCKIGFITKKISDGNWEITSVPERWTLTEYDLKAMIFVKHIEPEQIIRSIAAMTACKAAVKDGYVLDSQTAQELVEKGFSLPDPHCPHGRPIYTVISRNELFEMVKRT